MRISGKETDSRKELVAKLAYELSVLRARLGISQAELARKIGMSRQTYNTIETGKKEMSWMTFMALIAVFQGNEQTKRMLLNIEKFNEGLDLLGCINK